MTVHQPAEAPPTPGFTVVSPGTLTTVQDWPGRSGAWSAGVPPSGPMDGLSFRLGNLALGNPQGAAGLEVTMAGPVLQFHTAATIMVTGAPTPVTIDAVPVEQWVGLEVPAGALVAIGTPSRGMRSYLLISGGVARPPILGSAATYHPGHSFDAGQLAGLAGPALRAGDMVPVHPRPARPPGALVPPEHRPPIHHAWRLAVLEGPHGAPSFSTEDDVAEFYAAHWTVQLDARAGVQLSGPKPTWARRDGGEAGPHPSSIQPTPYAVGAVSYPGDQPLVIGLDGPSLGRYSCPATVISADRWKLGQLRPGDTVQFVPVTDLQADDIRRQRLIAVAPGRAPVVDGGVLLRRQATGSRPKVTFRRSGDDNLLIEYGEMTLDLSLRIRVHALADAIGRRVSCGELTGIVDITPGARSLQLHVDPDTVSVADLLSIVRALDEALPSTQDLVVPSRTVRLPLSWADPTTGGPANLEFLRRINGLDSVEDIERLVFAAEYLVLGLGAAQLGGPVTTPLDPRHRLVTSRCDPPRSWTPQDAVGLDGGYLSIIGPADAGDHQLVGQTVPIWSPPQPGRSDPSDVPWLLRCFDRIRWYRVDPAELRTMRAGTTGGTSAVTISEGTFSMRDYNHFLADNLGSIAEFSHQQSSAFADHRLAAQRARVRERSAGPVE